MEQLAVLGKQVGVETLPIVEGQKPAQIAQRALQAARLGGFDVVLLDTAGRTTLDDEMMAEATEIKRVAQPHEVLLIADALTGQDAVNLARSFNERVGLTGIVLTRVDGDGRGGAALSMRAVTGKPIKLLGTGEKMDALENFDPGRIAGRILGMGDIVLIGREGGREYRRRKGPPRRREDAQGVVRSLRPARTAHADAGDGRHVRPDGHDAGRRQDEGADGQCQSRRFAA
jgi:signal recognition particle GTPase